MEADSQGARIFLVEDESIVAMDVQSRLAGLGYKTVGKAAEGEKAVQQVLETQPDCVLMDIHLRGEMDGIEAARLIHEEWSVPVIYLTAYTDSQTLERARVTNPFGYILKPFQERELAVTIEMAIYKHRMEKELLKNREFLRITLESINDAVLAVGEDKTLLYANTAARSLLRMPRGEGYPLAKVLPGEVIERLPGGTEKELGFTLPWNDREGEEQDLEVDYTPLLTEDRWSGGVYVFRDVSQQFQYEDTLREAKAQAEEINRTRERLLSNISHELRTPLNSIIGMTELALGETAKPSVQEYLQVALQSAGSLLQVVNSILDYTRMESGRMALEVETIDILELTERVAEGYRGKQKEKGGDIQVEAQGPFSSRLCTDPEKIRLMLKQLLDNAVKFSNGGTVRVVYTWAGREDWEGINPEPQQGGSIPRAVRMDVVNQGRGISEERAQRIFSAFTQADSSATRRYGGLGIGLTLVKELAEMMGGRVKLMPPYQDGARFRVVFPVLEESAKGVPETGESSRGDLSQGELPQAPGEQGEAVSPEKESETGKGRVLALVEDDPTNRFVTSRLLGQREYQVVELEGASQFYEYLDRGETPDAVLLDIQMPEIDGYTVLQELREGKLGQGVRNLPVVVLTAHAQEEDRQRCYSYGADGYLTKPFDAQLLFSVLGELLDSPSQTLEAGDSFWEDVDALAGKGAWRRADERVRSCREEGEGQLTREQSRNLLKLSLALRQENIEETRKWLGRCRTTMED